MHVRHLVSVLVVLAAGACGGVMPAEQPANAPLRVENTQMFITVENRSGLALREVTIQIVPVGRSTDFSIIVPRLENGDKRDFPLGSFRGREGTPFNLRVVRPKSVKVSGTNINNQVVEVEVPWQK
jgi:hypothetical protein